MDVFPWPVERITVADVAEEDRACERRVQITNGEIMIIKYEPDQSDDNRTCFTVEFGGYVVPCYIYFRDVHRMMQGELGGFAQVGKLIVDEINRKLNGYPHEFLRCESMKHNLTKRDLRRNIFSLLDGEKHSFHRSGTILMRVSGVEVGTRGSGSAPVIEEHPGLPTDGTNYRIVSNHLYDDIDIGDVNQLTRDNCYYLAFLAWLTSTAAGQAKIKTRIIADPADPNQIIGYINVGASLEAVFCDYQFSDVGGTPGPDKDVWALAAIKIWAYARKGLNTYTSEDFGFWNEAALAWGIPAINTPRNMADAQAMAAAGMGIAIATPSTLNQPGIISGHMYTLINGRWFSCWNGNSGGTPIWVDFTDAQVASWGLTYAACAAPGGESLPLPDSVTPATLPPAVPDSPSPIIYFVAGPIRPGAGGTSSDGNPIDRCLLSWSVNGSDPHSVKLTGVPSVGVLSTSPVDSKDVEQWQGINGIFTIMAISPLGVVATRTITPSWNTPPASIPFASPAWTLAAMQADATLSANTKALLAAIILKVQP